MTSAWELDDREVQPCVVCDGTPDRTVTLPTLPDVHLVFGSSALCEVCAGLGAANAVDELSRRGELARSDEPAEFRRDDAVPSLVRLVVAAFGHRPPPAQIAPEEFRHRSVEPLSDTDRELWRRFEPLLYDGPAGRTVRVRGVIVHSTADHPEPVVTQAFRDGPKARLADGHERPWLLCDGTTLWRSDGGTNSAMYADDYDGTDHWAGDGSDLAARRRRHDVELFGFGTPLGPFEATTYLDRPAWRFRFAAPGHKPFDMAVIVDDETGFVLEKRFGEHSVAQWTSFESGVDLPAELFVWDGPVVDREQLEHDREDEFERHRRQQEAWFAQHVTASPLRIRGDVVEVMLHVNEDDGSFEASLRGGLDGALARRPRSDRWWALGWSEVTHRWSDEQWDWALSDFDDRAPRLTNDELDALQQALRRG